MKLVKEPEQTSNFLSPNKALPPRTISELINASAKNAKRIGNHAILMDRMLGKGHYGKVYLGFEVP